MIDNDTLLRLWQNAVDIIPDGDDSVFLGTLKITDAPAGVDAVMACWTGLIDTAMQEPGIGDVEKLVLLTLRGFTHAEYTTLFDIGIKEYGRYPIYRSLLITTPKERAGVIYQLSKDSYADYLELLRRTLRLFNPLLYTFLYDTSTAFAD